MAHRTKSSNSSFGQRTESWRAGASHADRSVAAASWRHTVEKASSTPTTSPISTKLSRTNVGIDLIVPIVLGFLQLSSRRHRTWQRCTVYWDLRSGRPALKNLPRYCRSRPLNVADSLLLGDQLAFQHEKASRHLISNASSSEVYRYCRETGWEAESWWSVVIIAPRLQTPVTMFSPPEVMERKYRFVRMHPESGQVERPSDLGLQIRDALYSPRHCSGRSLS